MAQDKEHELVPIHEILSEAEAKKVLDSLSLSLEKMPRILASDPQAQKLGAKPGQLIKISRNDAGAEYDYYRVVVEG